MSPLELAVVDHMVAEAPKQPLGVGSSLVDFLKANAPWIGKAAVEGVFAALESHHPDLKGLLDEIRGEVEGNPPKAAE